jgi:hypothetical protein
MTTYAENRSTTATSRPLFAALGIGVSLVLTAMGTFWDMTGNDGSEASDNLAYYLPVVGIILVAAALVFGLGVRTEADKAPGTRAIVMAVLGFVSLAVFWAGLPAVLAAGSATCALAARRTDGRLTPVALASLGIASATVVAAVILAVIG